MTRFVRNTLVALLGAGLSFSACSKEEKKDTGGTEPAAEPEKDTAMAPETAPAKPTDDSEKAGHFAKGMMDAYETCRTLLAGDKTEGIGDCAKGIMDASKMSHARAPEAAHEHIGAVMKAAEALAAAPSDDIEKLRLSFGELSKSIVAMLGAAPEAAKGYHVFECPMAKGYKRWAQPTADMGNPYTKMLTCGSEVHDHHKAMMGDKAGAAPDEAHTH